MATLPEKETPSALTYAISSAVLGLVAGYFIGQAQSIGLFSTSSTPQPSSRKSKSKRSPPAKSWPNSYDVTIHPDSSADEAPATADADDEDDDSEFTSDDEAVEGDNRTEKEAEDEDIDGNSGGDLDLADFTQNKEEVKLMLIVRTDLGMTKGKIAAQCGHATLACYKSLLSLSSSPNKKHAHAGLLLRRWENNGQPKIAVQTKSEEELQTLEAQAVSLGLCARVVRDAGRTQIAAGSATVLGVIGPKGVVDQVTGGLKLL